MSTVSDDLAGGQASGHGGETRSLNGHMGVLEPVSYTHLTLPTILRV